MQNILFMRNRVLATIVLCLLCACSLHAQGSVHWQTAINDTLQLQLNVNYTASPRSLHVDAAYVVRRGKIRKTPVQIKKLKSNFTDETVPSFTISVEFRHQGVRYRARGRYTDGGESLLRCMPLRLSKETMREGEYM